MLIAFFDVHGIALAEFLSQGQIINQHVYKNILQRLMRSVREKRREMWETRLWLLHHDDAQLIMPWELRVSCQKKDCCTGATTLLSRSGPL